MSIEMIQNQLLIEMVFSIVKLIPLHLQNSETCFLHSALCHVLQ